jgi:hypothetical protein
MSTQTPPLINRKQAGLRLATRLRQFHDNPQTLTFTLPRGGDEGRHLPQTHPAIRLSDLPRVHVIVVYWPGRYWLPLAASLLGYQHFAPIYLFTGSVETRETDLNQRFLQSTFIYQQPGGHITKNEDT